MIALRWQLSLLIIFGLVEVIGVVVGTVGVVVEVIYEADIGFILITAGALVFAVGSGLWAKVYVHTRHE